MWVQIPRGVLYNIMLLINEFVSLILEGNLERETTDISRKIMRKLIAQGKQLGGYFDSFQFKIDTKYEKLPNLKGIRVGIIFDESIKSLEPVVQGSYSKRNYGEEILITIEVNKAWENFNLAKKVFPSLLSNLKMTIRHEIEHTNQDISTADYPYTKNNIDDILQYFLEPLEVEAFVVGLYKKAKMKKVSFYELMYKYIERQVYAWSIELGVSEQDATSAIQKIKDAWESYARKRFPEAH